MKMMKTKAGTELPLVQLKGKDYLQVAHRLVWVNEENAEINIDTNFLVLNDEQSVVRAVVTLRSKEGTTKSATATKRETKKDFSDHSEKAETGAVGRALAMLGYGTQFAMADLDEGDRIVDNPVTTKIVGESSSTHSSISTASEAKPEPKADRSPFRRVGTTKPKAEPLNTSQGNGDDY